MIDEDRLTNKQLKFLLIIKKFIDEKGYSPSVRELCKLTGLNSTSTPKGYLDRLKRKGYITFIPNEARTIRIVGDIEDE